MTINDKVICISLEDIPIDDSLIINKVYRVLSVNELGNRYLILDETENEHWYFSWRFTTLKQLRKDKLNKLKYEKR